jgi:LacI family transcriptional regulator
MDLKELAQRLGLSMTTVSRALNGYSDVSAATRQRVVAAAQRYGYTPNAIARKLSSGRAGAAGVVLPMPAGHFADPFFLELLVGIGETLRRSKLDLIVTAAPAGEEEIEAYRHLVEGRRVDGLIVGRIRSQDERLAYLKARRFPFVCHGRAAGRADYAYLDVDGRSGFIKATERLLELGHRRIGLINAREEYNFARLRREGYLAALEAAGLAPDPALILSVEMCELEGEAAARALLALPDAPTALLCGNDLLAMGAIKGVKASDSLVGRDVSVIGYDDLPFAAYTEPPLTTLRQPIRESGARLAEMLLARLAGTPGSQLQEIWQPELILRGSDGPPPARATAPTTPEPSPPRRTRS